MILVLIYSLNQSHISWFLKEKCMLMENYILYKTLLIDDVWLLLQRETNLFMKQQFKNFDYRSKIMAHVKYETGKVLRYIEI